ncbi:MAG TPA: S53 family peptidase [Sphingomicrobium sp.]|jgi:subtilase family serine protease
MKLWKFGALALAGVFGVAITSAAPAAPAAFGNAAGFGGSTAPAQIERFGNIFAVSVCGRFSPAGSAHCYAKVVTDARGNIKEWVPAAGLNRNATPSGFGPADLRAAYGLSPASGSPGTGPTIAIVDAYGYPNAEADLGKYRAQFGLGTCTKSNGCLRIVNQTGGTSLPRLNVGWAQEQALDLDMASAMCPNCKILLVQATNSYLNSLATATNTAAKLGAVVISNSYGGDEGGTTSYESAWNHSGVAVTVSSGDYGYGVQFPASSPHVVAVGGTHLTRSGGGWSETAWNGAGSGCSGVYGILANTQSSGTTGCPNRAVSDVSAVADPSTGVAVYGPVSRTRSGWLVFGGTSVAAPLVGGIYGAAGGIVSYPTTKLYGAAGNAFRDITSGSNGSCPTTQWCNAGPGWDGPTGLGTAQGASAF